MTDDEAITLAILHGALFGDALHVGRTIYFVEALDRPAHPVEARHYSKTGRHHFRTKAELAHAYCAYYGLTTEVTDGERHEPAHHERA